LAKATLAEGDLAYLVSATNGYTGAQLEELANTLYIQTAQKDTNIPNNGNANRDVMWIDGGLIHTALTEVKAGLVRKVGFQAP